MNDDSVQGHNSAHGERAHKGHTGAKSDNIYPRYDYVTIALSGAAGAGNYDSAAAIPAGAVVKSVTVDVTVAFDGAATILVGDTVTADLFIAAGEINLLSATPQCEVQSTPSPTGNVARATIGGAPTTGTATVRVVYDVP